jgi:hypothetical protein
MTTRIRNIFVFLFALALGFAQGPIQHIQAELHTSVKVAKAKVGDTLKAQTVAAVQLAGGRNVPAGSQVFGRILSVDKDTITVVFDEVSVDGKRQPIAIALTGLAWMGESKQVSQPGPSQIATPAAGESPNDHPLNGSRYSVTEAGNNALNGVSHETLAEVNAKPSGAPAKGADVAGQAGVVIGMPGLKLTIADAAPYASRVDFEAKEHQLPKGLQLMFSVR